MSLVSLTNTVIDRLNSMPSEAWSYYQVSPDPLNSLAFVKAEFALDPDVILSVEKSARLFIIPLFNGYEISESGGRDKKRQIETNPTFSMNLLVPFRQFSEADVSSQEEIQRVLNLREEIELAIIRGNYGKYKIKDVSPEPPLEIELNEKLFLGTTEFQFSHGVCGES